MLTILATLTTMTKKSVKEYIVLNYSTFQNTNVEIYFNDISDI